MQQQRAAPAAVGSIVADDARKPSLFCTGRPVSAYQNGAERWQIRVDFVTKRVARGGSAIQESLSDRR
jgi:hypothetical protein